MGNRMVQRGAYTQQMVAVDVFPSVALQCRKFCQTTEIPVPSDIERRRKRLLWRARCRGWLELDVLMGKFCDKHIWEFEDDKLDLLEEVLELENPDLFKWFTGQAAIPAEILDTNEVMAMLADYVKQDHGAGLNDK